MNNKAGAIAHNSSIVLNIMGSLFGIAVLLIGLINTTWGNDPFFGVFLILLAFIYFPQVNAITKEMFDFTIPMIAKIGLGIFIVWAAAGIGELDDKIGLMMKDL